MFSETSFTDRTDGGLHLTNDIVVFVLWCSVGVHLIENVDQMNVAAENSHTEEIEQYDRASGQELQHSWNCLFVGFVPGYFKLSSDST